MPTYPPVVFTLDGAEVFFQPGWSINSVANARTTFSGVIATLTGSFRPEIDDELIVVERFGTSVTSTTIGTGSKTFATQAGMSIIDGQRVRVYYPDIITSWMEGVVTSYVGTSLEVSVDLVSGSGTAASWIIGVRIFGGQIQSIDESGLGKYGVDPFESVISAVDFNCYFDREYINGVLFSGSLESMLVTIVDLMDADTYGFGVTLHPSQATGVTLPDLTLPFIKLIDLFTNYMAPLSGGWLFHIDFYKVLRMYPAGLYAAPFDLAISDGNAIGDIEVQTTRVPDGRPYANRIYLVWGGTPATIRRMNIVSNTATNPTVITCDEPHQLFTSAIVTIDDNVGSSASINGSGHYVTLISPTTFSIPVDCTGSGGTGGTFIRTDSLSSPIYAQADDAGEQAARGLWSLVITVSGLSDADTAEQLAESYLAMHSVRPKRVNYNTFRQGIQPGQTQTITIPARNITGSFLITEVQTGVNGNLVQRRVSAYQGDVVPSGTMALYKLWSGGGSGSTSVAAVTGSPSTGGTQSVLFLGGSETEWVINGGAYQAASAVRVQVNTATRGSVYGTCLIRLRARSGNVTARLRNVTDGITVGTSATITSTTWQDTSFGVELTDGTKVYELQIFGSIADADIAAVGFLE